MIDNLEKPTPVEAALGSNLNKGTVRLIGRTTRRRTSI